MSGTARPAPRASAPARTEIVVVSDATALAREAAKRVAGALAAAVKARGRATIALAGGRTPRETYHELAETGGIPWQGVQVFFGDERCVAPQDERSNYLMARETLLGNVSVPPPNVHRIRGEAGPAIAADEYDALLGRELASGPLDVVLLGMGEDGHVASLFPGHPALEEERRRAVGVEGPGIEPARVSLTLPVLNAAAAVLVLVSGAAKAQAVRQALGSGATLPAARVRPQGALVWLLDLAAARVEPR